MSFGAPRNLVKVVARGSRAICSADTDTGLTVCVAATGATVRVGLSGAVPQEAARGITVSALYAIIFVDHPAPQPGMASLKQSRKKNSPEFDDGARRKDERCS